MMDPGLRFLEDNIATLFIPKELLGKPGKVAAAGPSLARNTDIARTAEGRAIVIGLNTSLPQLARGEAVPDMVAVVEGLDLRSQFDVPFLDHLVDVPDLIAHAGFFRLGARHNAPGAKFGTQRIEYDAASGKVVTVERSETLDQIRAAGGLADENELMGEEVVAYGGQGKVVTTKMLSLFRRWFGLAAKTWASDCKRINATEGGARIDGFEEMTLSQALKTIAEEHGLEERKGARDR